jgi:hypothetical protein
LVVAGEAVGQLGIAVVVWLNAVLLAAASFAGRIVPVLLPTPRSAPPSIAKPDVRGLGALLQLPLYRRMFWSQL